MWIAIFAAVIICAVLSVLFLLSRFGKFSIVKKISGERKNITRLVSVLILSVIISVLTFTIGFVNCVICILHLVAVWGISDIIAFIVKKIRKKPFERYYSGGISIVFTAIYLCFGWYCAHNVWRTEYNLKTDKNVKSLKIVQLADSHIGTTFNADGFAEHMENIRNEAPDAILLTGDFVDDGTTREDMFEACRVLGSAAEDTKYGVFLSYGNHDKGYYSEDIRGWSVQELENALKENGVVILEDESVLIDDSFYIIGRYPIDSYEYMDELTAQLDRDKYMIVMDHQPFDYDAQAESGVDLVLSGHTHGGQLIPITYAGEWMGVNCRTYGHEKRNNTDFIVTSGISDWAMDFKTGCKSEYVVINIDGQG